MVNVSILVYKHLGISPSGDIQKQFVWIQTQIQTQIIYIYALRYFKPLFHLCSEPLKVIRSKQSYTKLYKRQHPMLLYASYSSLQVQEVSIPGNTVSLAAAKAAKTHTIKSLP